MLRELKREGIPCRVKRVWTETDFLVARRDPALDLILADYSLPSYDGLSALELAQQERPEVPFIFVSGALGEETAIDALHLGATDYVLKQRLNRLGPAVRRALREAGERRQLAQMTRQLAESEKRYRRLVESLPDTIFIGVGRRFDCLRVSARLLERDGSRWVRLIVEDHGGGVPPEVRDRVFDPFFTTKTGKGGTGLGLSISHGIAKDHRGELHFETPMEISAKVLAAVSDRQPIAESKRFGGRRPPLQNGR